MSRIEVLALIHANEKMQSVIRLLKDYDEFSPRELPDESVTSPTATKYCELLAEEEIVDINVAKYGRRRYVYKLNEVKLNEAYKEIASINA